MVLRKAFLGMNSSKKEENPQIVDFVRGDTDQLPNGANVVVALLSQPKRRQHAVRMLTIVMGTCERYALFCPVRMLLYMIMVAVNQHAREGYELVCVFVYFG